MVPIIQQQIDPENSASGTVDRSVSDKNTNFTFYLIADEDSASVDVEFRTKPDGLNWYEDEAEELQNEDISDGKAFRPETRGSKQVQIIVTNQDNDPINVTVEVKQYVN